MKYRKILRGKRKVDEVWFAPSLVRSGRVLFLLDRAQRMRDLMRGDCFMVPLGPLGDAALMAYDAGRKTVNLDELVQCLNNWPIFTTRKLR